MTYIRKRHDVHVLGSGSRTLLFVNGFGCDQTIWHYLTPALSGQFRLVLFDHVGAGMSDVTAYEPAKYSSLEGYAQDVVDICRELDLSNVTLVGHSVGAMIGMLAAIAEPALFEQLLFLCPSPCYVNEGSYHGGFERQDIQDMLAFMDQDFVGWADEFAPFVMGNPDQPALAAGLLHSFCRNDPTIAKRFARVTFLSDNRADVGRCHTPCLLVQCARDLIAPLEVGSFLAARLPTARLITLPVSGHCPHVSAPTETLEALEAYMAA
ncbi:alpha/beta fold hydrolase [Hymenobacter rubripertinctus]|uniref:Alpha/beta hydrolase n=1 Tax=Hymenobacter rubripertinctus TaxID=2029981 RepID=A0A418QVT0_9BACT|nr:alpha/beta hydrolase [Hymenobacter rubripertinctus]RIY09100.1 alpha/beta hydrolase [Hymenobacter rubripertinctus]